LREKAGEKPGIEAPTGGEELRDRERCVYPRKSKRRKAPLKLESAFGFHGRF